MDTYKNMKILLAEDDKNLGRILKNYLSAKGFMVELLPDGKQAWDAFRKESFDFCIVDVMMPIMDGFTLVKKIRDQDKAVPVIFLTAKSLKEDKLKGFLSGADDYMTKPFSMEELLARMQAVLRRTQVTKSTPKKENFSYQIGKMTLDFNRRLLKYEGDGEVKKLTSKEAQLLKMLADYANETLDRSDALKEIWRDDNYFNARSMDVYIAKLRKYLKKDPSVELINVHGVGFKLVTT